MFLNASLPSTLVPFHNTFPVPETCASLFHTVQVLWHCQMSTKDVGKKLLNPFLHLLKERLWTPDSSSERLMHSLTAPSHSPFIYHFNLFAVSGKTEDTASQRIQGNKGLLEVIDTWLSEQKTTASTAFPGAEAALPGKSPLSSEAIAQVLLCCSENVIPGFIHEIIHLLEAQLIPTQELGICSPVLAIYPKSRGAGMGSELPPRPLPL